MQTLFHFTHTKQPKCLCYEQTPLLPCESTRQTVQFMSVHQQRRTGSVRQMWPLIAWKYQKIVKPILTGFSSYGGSRALFQGRRREQPCLAGPTNRTLSYSLTPMLNKTRGDLVRSPTFLPELQNYISERTLFKLHLIKGFSTQLRGLALLEIRPAVSALLRTWRCAERPASYLCQHDLSVRNTSAKGEQTAVISESISVACKGSPLFYRKASFYFFGSLGFVRTKSLVTLYQMTLSRILGCFVLVM